MKLTFLSIKNYCLNIWYKYKKNIILAILIFLIASLSFGLGFITAFQIVIKTPIIIEKCSENSIP